MKQITGFNYYYCNESGEIFSFKRRGNWKEKTCDTPSKLVPKLNNSGYYYATLDGRKYLVHRLILKTFSNVEPINHTVNHKDGNKLNNKIENLEWLTQKQNNLHAINILGKRIGKWKRSSKITNHLIEQIKELRASGMSYRKISSIVNIENSWCYRIASGKAWPNGCN